MDNKPTITNEQLTKLDFGSRINAYVATSNNVVNSITFEWLGKRIRLRIDEEINELDELEGAILQVREFLEKNYPKKE